METTYGSYTITYNRSKNRFECKVSDIKMLHSETLDGIEAAIDRYEDEPKVEQASQPGFYYDSSSLIDIRTSTFHPVKFGAFGILDSSYTFRKKAVWMTKKGKRERVDVSSWRGRQCFADTPENREIINNIAEIEKTIKVFVMPLKEEQDRLFKSLAEIKPTIDEDKLPSWS